MPPTYKSPPIPTPPVTCNAPDCVELASVLLVIVICLVVLDPLPVILSSVLVFQIVTLPVAVLTAVSVPATIAVTPKFGKEISVITLLLLL